MSTPAALLFLALIALVATVIVSPLNTVRMQRRRRSAALADLEAQRESKYREIRDAELDHEMGKHSEQDYELVDAALRSEALAILKSIEALQRGDDDATPAGEESQAAQHDRRAAGEDSQAA